jgi:hypothetical protein
MGDPTDFRGELISYLERQGLELIPTGSGDDYRVAGRTERVFLHEPVFSLPVDLLSEYLHTMSEEYRDQPDPLREALSLTKIHAAEYLTTDHGDGLNGTTALGFRRTGDGGVEFFHELDVPPVPRRRPVPHLRWEV